MNWLSSLSMATLIVCCPALTLLTAIVARLTVRALVPAAGRDIPALYVITLVASGLR